MCTCYLKRWCALLVVGVYFSMACGTTRTRASEPDPAGPETQAESTVPAQQPAHVVVVRFSKALFDRIQRPIDRVTPVRRTILGTDIRGTARTRGQIGVEITADEQRGSFIFHFTGTVHSQTQGRNGPALIHSRSATHFHAVKRIVFNLEGGFRCGPCAINSVTRSETCGIDVGRGGLVGRVIERVAWRRVGEQKAEADRIANRMVNNDLRRHFDVAVDAQLAELNQRDDLPALITALLGEAIDSKPTISTTHQYLQICFQRHAARPATLELPEDRVPGAPVEIWFHSSIIDRELPEVLKGYESLLQVITPLRDTATLSRVLERAPRADEPPRVDLTLAEGWFVLGLSRERGVRSAAR